MTWGLLYHSSLKTHWIHKLGSFRTEILQDLQRYSNFLTASKSEGYSPFNDLFWRLHILEIMYKNWVPSINEKWVQICSLTNQICEKVKKNYFEGCNKGYIATKCREVKKSYAISLLCNITQVWQLLSVWSKHIHLAVI